MNQRIRPHPTEWVPHLWLSAYPCGPQDLPPGVTLVYNLCRSTTYETELDVPVVRHVFSYWEQNPDPYLRLAQLCREVAGLWNAGETVLIHCRLGLDRTAVVALAVARHIYQDDETLLARYLALESPAPDPAAIAFFREYCARMEAARC